MKRIAYYALHYGAEYLAWSVRSIQHAVDEIHVLYSASPSFGHGTTARCPETEEQLHAEALRFLEQPSKLHWHRGVWHQEGEHRSALATIQADLVLHVDADEVWIPAVLEEAFQKADQDPHWSWRVPFVHFWRSFYWVCTDGAHPERVLDRRVPREGGARFFPGLSAPVLHFGYAQSEAITEYKWLIHGHRPELRTDCDWLEEKFKRWQPGVRDVHPTCLQDFWVPQATPADLLGHVCVLLHDHPYFDKDIIR